MNEKLEKELKFLKETYEANIITKEEFEKGKKRIEEKLKKPEEEIKIEEVPKEELEKKEIEEFAKEITSNQEKKAALEEERPKEEIKPEEIKPTEEKKVEEQKEEEKEPRVEIIKEEPIKINKKSILTISILIVLALILIFFFRIKPTPTEEIQIEEETTPTFQPACTTDLDCQKEGKIGTCINPNTKDAECEFRDDISVSLTVINNCVLCDTTKKINTIKQQLFPGAKETIIDYNSDKGKELISRLGIEALPAFIFEQNITKTHNYENTKNSFIKIGNDYIWSPILISNYYFKRNRVKNKLDLYIIPRTNRTIKTEKNLKEVLDLFGDKINFKKHLVEEEQKITLEKELGIKTYPTFLINNQLKFSGILSAEMIKEKFCALNKLEECSTTLSTDIK